MFSRRAPDTFCDEEGASQGGLWDDLLTFRLGCGIDRDMRCAAARVRLCVQTQEDSAPQDGTGLGQQHEKKRDWEVNICGVYFCVSFLTLYLGQGVEKSYSMTAFVPPHCFPFGQKHLVWRARVASEHVVSAPITSSASRTEASEHVHAFILL